MKSHTRRPRLFQRVSLVFRPCVDSGSTRASRAPARRIAISGKRGDILHILRCGTKPIGTITLPPGAQFAVLLGDPSKPGAPYIFRAKLPDGYGVPPHWHPMDEKVTVISGIFQLGLGEKFGKDALRDLPAGSYAMLPSGLPHYYRIKGETVKLRESWRRPKQEADWQVIRAGKQVDDLRMWFLIMYGARRLARVTCCL